MNKKAKQFQIVLNCNKNVVWLYPSFAAVHLPHQNSKKFETFVSHSFLYDKQTYEKENIKKAREIR